MVPAGRTRECAIADTVLGCDVYYSMLMCVDVCCCGLLCVDVCYGDGGRSALWSQPAEHVRVLLLMLCWDRMCTTRC